MNAEVPRGPAGLEQLDPEQAERAAWAACRAVGLGPKAIQKALVSFPGLPHRMEIIGAAKGVTFVNDSKATNADAAEKALKTFDRIRWIERKYNQKLTAA